MERKTLVAETTVTDRELGEFSALVSAWDADREGDVIAVTAFDSTISAWRASRKSVPLLWEHSADVVGHIDPATMHATQAGLVAAGEIDRDTDRGAMAWRMIKSGVAGFSVGFMAKSEPRPGGGRRLKFKARV
jgi:HK97 family phage prohead protease